MTKNRPKANLATDSSGFNCPIVVDPGNLICAGHTRWKAAKKLVLKTVPVIKVDRLTGDKFLAFNIADNQTASIAEWENDLLAELLAELKTSGTEIAGLGFTERELWEFFKDDEDSYSVPAVNPADVTSKIRNGDLIKLGRQQKSRTTGISYGAAPGVLRCYYPPLGGNDWRESGNS